MIVNTNNVSELIRWRKIRWRLFLFDQIPILVFHEFFVFPPLLIILVLGQKFEKFDFTKFFILIITLNVKTTRWKLFLFDEIRMYLKSVFSEIWVRTWVQVVSCQKSMPLIGRPDRSALAIWRETTLTHVLTLISEKLTLVHKKLLDWTGRAQNFSILLCYVFSQNENTK